MKSDFERLRRALAESMEQKFPGTKLEDFPADSEVAGVKVNLETSRGLADVLLYESGALDLEAVDKASERVLFRVHTDRVTPEELTLTIAELANAMD